MRTVVRSRMIVILGTRPRTTAIELFGDLRPGDEGAVFVLGLDPSPGQRRFTDAALELAAERRFTLTAELIPASSWLSDRVGTDDRVRVVAGRREARRWKLDGDGVRWSGA
jgi:hypothetical protein